MAQNSVALDGQEVARRRADLLLSQKELAKKAKIHSNTLQAIETDPDYRTSFRTVRNLAKALRCTPADLYPAERVAS